jgi:hypothetical protein
MPREQTNGGTDHDHLAGRRAAQARHAPKRGLDSEMRELASELRELDTDLKHAKAIIESNSRVEHWGKAPEPDWSWRVASTAGARAGDGGSGRRQPRSS